MQTCSGILLVQGRENKEIHEAIAWVMDFVVNTPLELIGKTPLVRINKLNPNPAVEIWAKLEKTNPSGSIKDRMALAMIRAAERDGLLTKDKIILEATSGNTGIGLAMIAAVLGYKIVLVMSEAMSVERRKILKAYGAEIVLTPGELNTDGAIDKAKAMLAAEPGKYFMPNQFSNRYNALAHYATTGPEIWEQTSGHITHFIAGMGTGGTLMGIGKYLKEQNSSVRIIGVEPDAKTPIQGLKNMDKSYRPAIFERNKIDEKVNITAQQAISTARMLAKHEGLLVGMSSGAAMAAAMQMAKDMTSGVIVVLLPDSGERYLSTELFDDNTIV